MAVLAPVLAPFPINLFCFVALFDCLLLVFERGSCYIAQVGLELMLLFFPSARMIGMIPDSC
jgi:hypothetical protein